MQYKRKISVRISGGRVPGGSADLVALINEFITETHRLTFHNLVILQNDAKACFDRIINNHSTLHSRRFEIPDKVCKIHSTTLRNIKYRVQTALGINTPFMRRYSQSSFSCFELFGTFLIDVDSWILLIPFFFNQHSFENVKFRCKYANLYCGN